MNRLSIKFIGGALLMFIISASYTFYAIFRIIGRNFYLTSQIDILTYKKVHGLLPIFKIAILSLDTLIVGIFMIFLWYFLIRFLSAPNCKYPKIFATAFLIAILYYFITPFLAPTGFCEAYDFALTCPSF